MIVYLLGLRERGELLALPPIRELEDVPPGLVRDGHLDYGSVQGRRGRCLHLRSGMSAPGCGVLAVLYQPTLTQVEHTFLKFRGFEPAEDAVHMQEWLVFPQWLQP